MAAFPYYDTGAIAALNAQAVALLKLFDERGYVREEPSVLQPAEIFLDRSGEEIRRRTFTLMDPSGRELCLRPDLTIPICRQAVQDNRPLPAAHLLQRPGLPPSAGRAASSHPVLPGGCGVAGPG